MIQLVDSDLTEEDLGKLIDTLAPTPLNTRQLTLLRVGLSDAVAVRLAREVLPFASKLAELDLQGNSIGDEGATAIAAALPQCTALKTLWLEDNSITDEGARAIAAALPQCTALTTLDLRDTGNIGEDAKQLLRAAAEGAGVELRV